MSGQVPPTKPVENRFLFVIETSAAASRSSRSARDVVRSLIESGIQGQMRAGDTLGLWTFNDQLSTTYPMQQWSPSVSKEVGARTDEYLKKLRFEKKSQLNVMWPSLESVIQSSKAVTIILISDGHEPIQGTPFDQEINSVYSAYSRSLRDSKAQFVTVLVGRNGKIVTHTVNSAMDAIQIPSLPLPVEVDLVQLKINEAAQSNKLAAAINQVAPPRKIAKENIIFPKPVATNQPPLANAVAASTTNETVNPLVTKTNLVVPTIPTTVTQAAVTVVSPVLETNSVPSPTKIVTAIAPTTPVPVATPIVAAVAAPPAPASNPATNSAVVEKATAVRPSTDLLPPRIDETQTVGSPSQKVEPTAKDVAGRVAPAAVVATQTPSAPRNFILIGVSLLVIAGVLVFVLIRASRAKSQPSLISRSMNHPPK